MQLIMETKLFKISTTEYEEEDFYVVTDLHENDLTEVINPLVMAERDGEGEYDNYLIFKMLKKRFPKNFIEIFNEPKELIY